VVNLILKIRPLIEMFSVVANYTINLMWLCLCK